MNSKILEYEVDIDKLKKSVAQALCNEAKEGSAAEHGPADSKLFQLEALGRVLSAYTAGLVVELFSLQEQVKVLNGKVLE